MKRTRFIAAAEIVLSAHSKLNVEIMFKTFPAERALRMSSAGKADGELVRVEGIDAKYKNLIRIPVSHVMAEQMVFATNPDLKVSGWKSLVGRSIVFQREYKVAEKHTVGMDRYLVPDGKTALLMLEKKRKDVAISNRFTGQKIIRDLRLKRVHMLVPAGQIDPLFHYLHVKH